MVIGHGVFYAMAFMCNGVLVSGTIFSGSRIDPSSSMNIYESEPRGDASEYRTVKRGSQDPQESADSKERRSQMGSSFVRFGRGRFEGDAETNDYASGSRMTRGRSDVIIRFGRSDSNDRHRNVAFETRDLDRPELVRSNVEARRRPRLGLCSSKLRRMCESLGFVVVDDEIIDSMEDSSQGISVRHE